MVVKIHGGSASPDYGEHAASQVLWLMETSWFSHRPLWTLMLSGVFDRFPGLRLVLAEMHLDRSPSEYWRTNCAVTASFMHPADCARWDRIGSGHIMWGSDDPHSEGTYPFSDEAIRRTFAGVPTADASAMLGGTAAAFYDFDLDALRPWITGREAAAAIAD